MLGCLAIVLHAHLPYVRHPEHERSFEERWLYEAILESYLPLVDLLDRLARDRIPTPLTISISPTLAAMLRDALLKERFEAHLARLEALARREVARAAADPSLSSIARMYVERLERMRGVWQRIGGDVVGALALHWDMGRIELFTTSATHAYLPALANTRSVRAQLRIGVASFTRVVGARPVGLWLPECAYDPRFEGDVVHAGARYVIVDAHGVELALPRPPLGALAPILAPSGLAFFARDPDATYEVWSREAGFPGHPDYRDFYRDVGFDRTEDELEGELGPRGTRVMTGLKFHRVTGAGPDKALYDPIAAAARAREHASAFLAARRSRLRPLTSSPAPCPPLVVAPYDAELFGHWWFEGPDFLENVLRELAAEPADGLRATTLAAYLSQYRDLVVARPAASSWGEGGYGDVWIGPEVARVWRHVHHTERVVADAVARRRSADGVAGRALERAIVELLLLEASDWPFMIHRGEMVDYARARMEEHASAALRLAALAIASAPAARELAWLDELERHRPLFDELRGEALRSAFDPW